jgi:hypothetical protein
MRLLLESIEAAICIVTLWTLYLILALVVIAFWIMIFMALFGMLTKIF